MRVMVTISPRPGPGQVFTGMRFEARSGIEVTAINIVSPWLVSQGQVFPLDVRVETIPDETGGVPLATLLGDVVEHDIENPGHGFNCACMDKYIREIRAVVHSQKLNPDEVGWEAAFDARRRISWVMRAAVREL